MHNALRIAIGDDPGFWEQGYWLEGYGDREYRVPATSVPIWIYDFAISDNASYLIGHAIKGA